jgi:hypothetical protein
LIREEFGDYEICTNCYGGNFRYGEQIQDTDELEAHESVYIVGSFDAFSEPHEMEPAGDGTFTCYIVMGETRVERFYLRVDGLEQNAIYPSAENGDATEAIVGPDAARKGHDWLINRKGEMPAGTVYLVKFEWANGRKKVSWEPVTEEPAGEILGVGYQHTCYVTGSWNRWELEEMPLSNTKSSVYEKSFKMPESGQAEFRFLRNKDFQQQIYPAVAKALDVSIPVRGPGRGAANKSFLVEGAKGEIVTVGLCILDGLISVTASGKDFDKEWSGHSKDVLQPAFGITGSFNAWGNSPMTPDPQQHDVYTFRFYCEYDTPESFQITVDGDLSYTMHPHVPGAGIMDGILQGPDRKEEGLSWVINGVSGQSIEISLDLNQTDRRRMVYWKRVADSPEVLKAIGRS